LILRLVGTMRSMNPTPSVYAWLQSRQWPHPGPLTKRWRIAAHVRVPEEFCPQYWKDNNHVSKLIQVLRQFQPNKADHVGAPAPLPPLQECQIDVYTEENFDADQEALLLSFVNSNSSAVPIGIHRGSSLSLLHDIQDMAMADFFVPSSSHLSALVGYLTRGVILLLQDCPLRSQYFQPHLELLESNNIQFV
jgi:hypothetical protein